MKFIDMDGLDFNCDLEKVGFTLQKNPSRVLEVGERYGVREIWMIDKGPPPILRQWKREKNEWFSRACYLLLPHEIERSPSRIAVTLLCLMKQHYLLTSDKVTVLSRSMDVNMAASQLGMLYSD